MSNPDKQKPEKTFLVISLEVADRFEAKLVKDEKVIGEYKGYVPKIFLDKYKDDDNSDCLRLFIEVGTNAIENWPLSVKKIKKIFKKPKDKNEK